MLRRLTVSAVLGLTLAVGAPTLAQAAGLSGITIIEERGDVFKEREEGPTVAAPLQKRGDIRRTTIRHRDRTITVRAKFVQLVRKPRFHGLDVRLRTNTGMWRDASVIAGGFGKQTFWRGTAELTRRNGRTVVDCDVSHNINYATNVIHMRIPRSCLDNPRWIQANVISFGIMGGRKPFFYYDSAHVDHKGISKWSRRLHHLEGVLSAGNN